MKLQHDLKIHPPRVKMTVTTTNDISPFILRMNVAGCSSENQLDMDITFPLGNQTTCVQCYNYLNEIHVVL